LYVEDDFTERAPSGEFRLEETEVVSKVLWYTSPVDLCEVLAEGVAIEAFVAGVGFR
jgi:hypothetical protein